MATIQRRGRSYKITVSNGYDVNGKQIRQSMTWTPDQGMTQRQAEKELQRQAVLFEEQVRKGGSNKGNMRLADFCAQYLQWASGTLAPTTIDLYRRDIDQLIKPALGHMKLGDIKPLHIQQYVDQLCELPKRNGEGAISPATVHNHMTVIKSIMARAYKLGLIAENPSTSTRLILPAIPSSDTDIFDEEELLTLLSNLEKETLQKRLLVHAALVTGCRRSELVALQWDCVDTENGRITIRQSAYKLSGHAAAIKEPKTKGSMRTVAIPDYLVEMLKDQKFDLMERRLSKGNKWTENNLVFPRSNGGLMNPTNITVWFGRLLRKLDIPPKKFHSLRHTSATLLLVAGQNVKNVSSRLGHTDINMTNRYLHAVEKADREAADYLESFVQSKIGG